MNRRNTRSARSGRILAACLIAAAGLAIPVVMLAAQPESQVALSSARRPESGVTSDNGARQPRTDDSLPIKRITLYRSGVGSFERRGLVDGDASIQLRFKSDQINDILKSMVVLDMGGGQVDSVRYGSKEPLARRLSSFGVDISDNPPAGEILNRLRGTPVRLALPEGEVRGTIMNIETRPTVYDATDKGANKFDLPWINLVTDSGVRSFNLTSVTGFEILDPNLAGELSKALAALAEHRADRTKTVDVSFRGDGARQAVIAYVQEMPVWKTSYRMVLPKASKDAKPSDTATIQGWAIVENTSDEDWSDVKLSLVSGRPVSFRMDLYEPLFMARPEVPVPTIPGVNPRLYEERKSEMPPASAAVSDRMEGLRLYSTAPGQPGSRGGGGGGQSPFRDAQGEREDLALDANIMAEYAARAQAQAVESGEVFQYELENPVTIERQQSAMLPIIATNVGGARVSIFNPADGSQHPMRGVKLVNSTNLQLLPGPLSVYDDGTYAGDAQIGQIPPGDTRLLAYAVDLDVLVTTETDIAEHVQKIKFIRGLMEFTNLRRHNVTYKVSNKDLSRARAMIIEHPRLMNWKLVKPDKAGEESANLYRFDLAVDAGKAAELAVSQETVDTSSFSIQQIDLPTLMRYQTSGQASQKVIDAFKEAARRQQLVSDQQQLLERLDRERNEINEDQNRIRQNMSGIDRNSQLYARYMQKLTEQESRIESIGKELESGRAKHGELQSDLNNYLSELSVE